MRTALRELVRRPGRFLPVGGALTLLVLLLMVLGGFLDGLTLSQTGSYRAQTGRLFVVADDAELQLSRSVLGADVRDAVEQVDGVAAVGALDTTTTTAALPREDELQDVVVYGYELATDVLPAPPADGEAVVDARLRRVADVAEGDTLQVGPGEVEVTVVGFVDDVSQGAATLWVTPATWREVAETANAAAPPPPDADTALVVEPADGIDLPTLADRIEQVADVDAATVDEVTGALPVVTQQAATFQGIIGVTFVVTLLVVALFFALLTLERVRLYAVLKAVGARSLDLVTGVAAQAVAVALAALVLGGALALGFVAVLPADLPVQLEPTRVVQVGVGTLVTALAGGLLTLRRILRVDPAAAIG